MHPEAHEWGARHATDKPVDVLDIGGRDVNGTGRDHFPNATTYTVLDIEAGPNVDIVADASTWDPKTRSYDYVVCYETFEHTDLWPAICQTAYRAVRPGGRFIVTTAAPGRPPHSGRDGNALQFGEYYANVDPAALQEALEAAGFVEITVDVQPSPADVRAVAGKPDKEHP